MREALRLLQMAGNLDIRHGSGIYVRCAGGAADADQSLCRHAEHRGILDLLQARLLIEPQVAELAAIQRHREAPRRSSRPPPEAEAHLSGRDAADAVLGIVNMRFHRAIAEGAANASSPTSSSR